MKASRGRKEFIVLSEGVHRAALCGPPRAQSRSLVNSVFCSALTNSMGFFPRSVWRGLTHSFPDQSLASIFGVLVRISQVSSERVGAFFSRNRARPRQTRCPHSDRLGRGRPPARIRPGPLPLPDKRLHKLVQKASRGSTTTSWEHLIRFGGCWVLLYDNVRYRRKRSSTLVQH